ncbi:hypothetical protein ACP275_12G068800 [Erythranthe tilingii]
MGAAGPVVIDEEIGVGTFGKASLLDDLMVARASATAVDEERARSGGERWRRWCTKRGRETAEGVSDGGGRREGAELSFAQEERRREKLDLERKREIKRLWVCGV